MIYMKIGMGGAICCVGLVAMLAGCGGGNSSSGSTAGAPSGSTEAGATGTTATRKAAAVPVFKPESRSTPVEGPGPTVHVPKGPPPKHLIVKEVKKGHGPVAREGDEVAVRYVGDLWTGQSYSNTWGWEEAPHYVLGAEEINPGLDHALHGMRVGGRRFVLIPDTWLYYPKETHGPVEPLHSEAVLIDLFGISGRAGGGSE